MRELIKTPNGDFFYEPMDLSIGHGYLNPITSKKNLLDFKSIMDKHDIHYGLWFGTLLGAIRENGFIKHDEDTDVFVLEENKNKVLNVLEDFNEIGLKIIRYDESSDILSFMRDNDYIDIYFYKESLGQRVSSINGINAKYLEQMKNIKFLGTDFPVPIEAKEALITLYGQDWNIPKEGGKAINLSHKKKMKNILINKLPFVYKLYIKIKDNIR